MNTNKTLIEDFYTAFQHKDYATMIGCYHDDVRFSDPVFQNLRGKQAKAMWHMLCGRGKDLVVSFDNVRADGASGQAHWQARYTFSTGRPVHNVIVANFVFKDGKIIEHLDSFDLWRWTRMALGPTGWFLGWSSLVQNKVRQTAVSQLHSFIAKQPQYAE